MNGSSRNVLLKCTLLDAAVSDVRLGVHAIQASGGPAARKLQLSAPPSFISVLSGGRWILYCVGAC